ncbi:MAG TPA: HlyD family secretion protein [Caulobacteraceae bacterium]|jgi:membrane fusion protein (multidrug efflux system)|nr:HlyD family secretion protein [Caulobacteraceae bacterium]
MVDGSGGQAASARIRWRALTVALVAAAAIAAGLVWIFSEKAETSTDDAYVQAEKTIVSPKVRGMVLQVVAQQNRPVAAGDLLVKIDPEEYNLQIAKAQGDLMAARAAQGAARAGLARLDAEEKMASAAVNTAQQLAGPKGPSDPLLRQAFETARGQALVAARTRGEIVASQSEAAAAEFRARTELQAAQLQKSQTSVVAPAAGTIADVQATVGQMVQPGVTLMTIVGHAQPVITANFKETQIGRMHAGLEARVKIDALPGQVFTGHVDSIAPGSGSQFALLPFEPGNGNFTKIVQRVPVRIVLDPGQTGLDHLRAGLSAEVTVKLPR